MTNPFASDSGGCRFEPGRRQRHDEDRGSADNAAYDDHSIGSEFLSKHTDDRDEDKNKDVVDVCQLADWSPVSQFAKAEFWKNVIHLHGDYFQETNEDEKRQQTIKAGLAHQLAEEPHCIARTITHSQPEGIPRTSSFVFFDLFGEDDALVRCFGAFANEIGQWEQERFQNEASEK